MYTSVYTIVKTTDKALEARPLHYILLKGAIFQSKNNHGFTVSEANRPSFKLRLYNSDREDKVMDECSEGRASKALSVVLTIVYTDVYILVCMI